MAVWQMAREGETVEGWRFICEGRRLEKEKKKSEGREAGRRLVFFREHWEKNLKSVGEASAPFFFEWEKELGFRVFLSFFLNVSKMPPL